MENEDKEYKKLLKTINKKLKNPANKKKIDDAIATIEDIFEAEIDISIVYSIGLNDYKKIFDSYDEEYLEKELPEGVMTLGELIEYLRTETDEKLQITIDPIYLDKKGINDIYDVIITTLENKIIIVPINKPVNE